MHDVRSAQGEMPDGTEVAVRRLPLNSRQGKREFVKGVKNMMEAHHRNVVRLIGCCYNTSRLLVYEHLHNGNLTEILFGTSPLSMNLRASAQFPQTQYL